MLNTHTLVESLEVNFFLCLGEFILIILALNLELLAHGHGRQVTKARDLNDGNLEWREYTYNHL